MEKLTFDTGLKEYRLGSGVLRFNPNDPNVYARFMGAMDQIKAAEGRLQAKAKKLQNTDAAGKEVLGLLAEADREIKAVLSGVFGGENDFDQICGGVSMLSRGNNGKLVCENLINALRPILEEGARSCAQAQIGGAVTKAQLNRAQRRAQGHK